MVIFISNFIHFGIFHSATELNMEGSTAEHSDSDSGESWTLLENTSAYGDDAPDFPENNPPFERLVCLQT